MTQEKKQENQSEAKNKVTMNQKENQPENKKLCSSEIIGSKEQEESKRTKKSKIYEESKHTKKLREEYIHFTDDFIFSKIMSDMDLCKEFLETILGEEIDGIVKHEAQKHLAPEYDARSMRLDVYTETAITMINTEMQKSSESQIGKRSRYSGSLMDKEQLSKGDEYKDLKARYVIFIYSRDPFKKGLPQYTFKSMCVEDKDVELNNGIVDIVINLKGNLDGTREDLKELIGYMAETINPKNCKSSLIHKIHKEVERANQDPEIRRMFVTVGERYLEIERESREEGIEIGESRGIEQGIEQTLTIIKMINNGISTEEIANKLDLPLEYIQSIVSRSK